MRRSRIRVVLLGALLSVASLCSLAFTGAALAKPTWLTPTKLAANASPESVEIAADPAGGATAIYINEGDFVEAVSRTPFEGASFATPVGVSPLGDPIGEARVGIDGEGVATVAWVNHAGGGIDVATVAGGIVSEPEALVREGGVSEPSLAVAENGAAVLAWVNEEGATSRIEAAYRPAGHPFDQPVKLEESTASASFPSAAIAGDGEALVTWGRSTSPSVVEATASDASGSFGHTEVVSNASDSAVDPAVAANAAGDGALVFTQSNGTKQIAQIATRTTGSAFGAPVALSKPASTEDEAQFPAVALDAAGEVTVAWMEGGAIEVAEGPLSSPYAEHGALSGVKGLFPSVAEDAAGNALVSWLAEPNSEESKPPATAEAAYRPAGGSFAIAHTVSAAGSHIDSGFVPQRPPVTAALEGAGNGFVAFQNEATAEPEVALLDAAGPVLNSLSIPATGTTGKPVTFSVSPADQISSIASTAWSFGDASSVSGASVTHTFADPGSYAVSVGATDAAGNTTSASGKIVITGSPTTTTKSYAGAKLVSASARAKANGGFRLRVKCIATTDCDTGSVQLAVTVKVDKLPPAAIKLGKDKFKAGSGARVYVTFKLSKSLLALLRKQKHLKLSAIVKASDFRGESATTEGKAKLKAPKAKKKGKRTRRSGG